MFKRWSLFVLLVLPSFVRLHAEEWYERFDQERKLALKKAGPRPMVLPARISSVPTQKVIVVGAPKTEVRPRVSRPKAARKPKKRPKRDAVPSKKSRVSHGRVDEIVGKAQRAREDGQLEHALRLYKLAESLEPEGREIKAGIAAVEQEMN